MHMTIPSLKISCCREKSGRADDTMQQPAARINSQECKQIAKVRRTAIAGMLPLLARGSRAGNKWLMSKVKDKSVMTIKKLYVMGTFRPLQGSRHPSHQVIMRCYLQVSEGVFAGFLSWMLAFQMTGAAGCSVAGNNARQHEAVP